MGGGVIKVSDYIAEFVAANPIITMEGTTEVYAGTIGYANVLGSA